MRKITTIIAGILGVAVGAGIVYKSEHNKYKAAAKINSKDNTLLQVFAKWMNLRQDGKFIADYLVGNGYHSVAIYGMHYLGECLLKELKNSSVEVRYAIDRNASNLYADVDILTLDDNIPEVDVVIVTAIGSFNEIEKSIAEIADYPVVSLEDIVYDMEHEN